MAETKAKLPGLVIDAIERKLAMDSGTTLKEIGADLTERFGKNKTEKLERILSNIASIEEIDPKRMSEITRKEKMDEFRKQKQEYIEARKAEISEWSKKAEAYINEEYGAPIKDGLGIVIGYGERIKFKNDTGHFYKNW